MSSLHLLDSGGARGDRASLEDVLRAAGLTGNGGRIRCPRCGWQPRRSSRWACDCGHAWNTFLTRALCPACGRQWRMTMCLSCHRWSAHEAWYAPCPSSSR